MNAGVRVGLAIAVVATVAVMPAALAAPVLSLNPVSVVEGDSVTADGSGFQGGGTVELFLDTIGGDLLASGNVSGAGDFRIRFVVPVTKIGAHSVIACTDRNRSNDCREESAASLIVNSPPTTTTTTTTTRPPTTTTTTTRPPTTTTSTTSTTTTSTTSTTQPTTSSTITTTTRDPGTTTTTGGVVLSTTTTQGTFGVSTTASTTTTSQPPLAIPTTVPPPGIIYQTPEDLPEWPNLRVLGIEVTQGIQNLENAMPLTAGRRTYARVYIDVEGQPEWVNVFGVLEAWRGGQLLGMVEATNNGITAKAGGGDRLELDDSLYFLLPSSWTSGEVVLQTLVWSYGIVTLDKEPESFDNVAGVLVEFHGGGEATLHPVPLHLHRSYHPTDVDRTYVPTFSQIQGLAGQVGAVSGDDDVIEGIWRYHPVSDVSVEPFPLTLYPSGHGSGSEWNLGPCSTTVVDVRQPGEAGVPALEVTDWEPFFEDPGSIDLADFTSPSTMAPDRTSTAVLDKRFDVNVVEYFPETGTVGLWGNYTQFDGPSPIPGAPLFVGGCKPADNAYGAPLTVMGLHRVFYEWAGSREYFIGAVDPSLVTRFGGLANDPLDSTWLKFNDAFDDNVPWRHGGADLVGHELGHLTGRSHAPCADSDGDLVPDELVGGPIDMTHPGADWFPDCRLAEIDPEGFYGFDVYHAYWGLPEPVVISNDPAVSNPNRAFPLMGYRGTGWTDPYHWCRMLDYYGTPCHPNTAGIAWNPPPPEPTDGAFTNGPVWSGQLDQDMSMAYVVGRLYNESGLVEYEPQIVLGRDEFEEPWALTPDPAQPGQPGLVVVFDDVKIADFALPVIPGHDDEDGHVVEFAGFVPVADGAVIRFVSASGAVLEETTVAIEPIIVASEGFDMDGSGRVVADAMTPVVDVSTFLQYSADGIHWLPVSQPVDSAAGEPIPFSSHAFPAGGAGDDVLASLPGSDAGHTRLVVTSGWSTQYIDGPVVTVPDKAPTVRIAAPLAGQVFATGQRVRLEATAFDLEDRRVSDGIVWSSSIDGPLGTGAALDVDRLSPGAHLITASTTDSTGQVGSASVEVVVDADVVQERLTDDERLALSSIIEALLAKEQPSEPLATLVDAADTRSGDDEPAGGAGGLPVVLILVTLLGGAAAGAFWSRSRASRP